MLNLEKFTTKKNKILETLFCSETNTLIQVLCMINEHGKHEHKISSLKLGFDPYADPRMKKSGVK